MKQQLLNAIKECGMTREDYESFLKKHKKVLDKHTQIMVYYMYSLSNDRKEIKISDFENPNWMYKRAFLDGQIQARNEIIKVLEGESN